MLSEFLLAEMSRLERIRMRSAAASPALRGAAPRHARRQAWRGRAPAFQPGPGAKTSGLIAQHRGGGHQPAQCRGVSRQPRGQRHLRERQRAARTTSGRSARAKQAVRRPPPQARRLSTRGQALATTYCATELEGAALHTRALPTSAPFPVTLWQRLQNKHWRMTYPDMLQTTTTRAATRHCRRAVGGLPAGVSQRASRRPTRSSSPPAPSSRSNSAPACWPTTATPCGLEDPAYWGAVKAFMATGLWRCTPWRWTNRASTPARPTTRSRRA